MRAYPPDELSYFVINLSRLILAYRVTAAYPVNELVPLLIRVTGAYPPDALLSLLLIFVLRGPILPMHSC